MPGQADLVVHGRVERIRGRSDEGELDGPDLVADVKDLLPVLPAVGRLEDAALGVRREQVPHHGDVDDIGVLGMDEDPGDMVRVAEAHVRPGLAGVDGLPDAVAGARAAGAIGLARSDPDDLGIGRGHGDVADRKLRLGVEDGLEGRAVVHRLPYAAVPGPDIERVKVLARRSRRHGEARHPRSGPVGTQGPAVETFEQVRGESTGCRAGLGAGEAGDDRDHQRGMQNRPSPHGSSSKVTRWVNTLYFKKPKRGSPPGGRRLGAVREASDAGQSPRPSPAGQPR